MTFDNDDLSRRRQRREELKKKRQAEHRKTVLGLAAGCLVLVLIGVGIFLLTRRDPSGPQEETQLQTQPPQTQPPETTAPPVETTPQQPATTVIHLAAAGDLNVTDASVAAGFQGYYDYQDVFMGVTPLLAQADLTLLNFEGNLIGAPYGGHSVSAPPELLEALANSGVDMLQAANSFSIRNGMSGLRQTLDAIRAAGMEPVGAYATNDEFDKSGGYTMMEVKGIRIAFVAFTKGMDNMGLPPGSEDCVNLLYTDYASTYQTVDEDGIRDVLRNVAEEEPDLVIALLHWGSEFNDTISATQKKIARIMMENGVDAIIGTHAHYVQQITFDEEAGTLIAYSLGDFYGDAIEPGTNYSIVLDMEITRDNTTGETRITNYSFTPIYTLTGEEAGGKARVVQISHLIAAYESRHLGRVSEETYKDLLYSLTRIDARTSGE